SKESLPCPVLEDAKGSGSVCGGSTSWSTAVSDSFLLIAVSQFFAQGVSVTSYWPLSAGVKLGVRVSILPRLGDAPAGPLTFHSKKLIGTMVNLQSFPRWMTFAFSAEILIEFLVRINVSPDALRRNNPCGVSVT